MAYNSSPYDTSYGVIGALRNTQQTIRDLADRYVEAKANERKMREADNAMAMQRAQIESQQALGLANADIEGRKMVQGAAMTNKGFEQDIKKTNLGTALEDRRIIANTNTEQARLNADALKYNASIAESRAGRSEAQARWEAENPTVGEQLRLLGLSSTGYDSNILNMRQDITDVVKGFAMNKDPEFKEINAMAEMFKGNPGIDTRQWNKEHPYSKWELGQKLDIIRDKNTGEPIPDSVGNPTYTYSYYAKMKGAPVMQGKESDMSQSRGAMSAIPPLAPGELPTREYIKQKDKIEKQARRENALAERYSQGELYTNPQGAGSFNWTNRSPRAMVHEAVNDYNKGLAIQLTGDRITDMAIKKALSRESARLGRPAQTVEKDNTRWSIFGDNVAPIK